MADKLWSPEEIEVARILVLLSQSPVRFTPRPSAVAVAPVEHEDCGKVSKHGRSAPIDKKPATQDILSESSEIHIKGNDFTSGKEKAMKLTAREKFNAWHQPLSRKDLSHKDTIKIHRVKWTKAEEKVLKANASLLERPRSMSRERRAALAAIFPNRSVGALHSMMCKMKVADNKAVIKVEGTKD